MNGALGLTFAQSRPFGDADLAYIASLARQAAQALDRTVLFDEERRARERAERLASDLARLHAFAVSLGAATSTSEVGTLVCEQVKAMLGASACALYVPNGTELMELLHGASDGEESDGKPYWPETLETALHPLASLWLERDEDWVENDRYESLRAHGAPAAVLPLAVTGRPTGTLVAWFPEDSYPQESARRLLETMVRQATQPLDRLRLLESERQARLEAQISALRTHAPRGRGPPERRGDSRRCRGGARLGSPEPTGGGRGRGVLDRRGGGASRAPRLEQTRGRPNHPARRARALRGPSRR